jgi:hypothetical protein
MEHKNRGFFAQAEMKSFAKCDGVVLKQHFEKKIVELEEEKKSLQVSIHIVIFDVLSVCWVNLSDCNNADDRVNGIC